MFFKWGDAKGMDSATLPDSILPSTCFLGITELAEQFYPGASNVNVPHQRVCDVCGMKDKL